LEVEPVIQDKIEIPKVSVTRTHYQVLDGFGKLCNKRVPKVEENELPKKEEKEKKQEPIDMQKVRSCIKESEFILSGRFKSQPIITQIDIDFKGSSHPTKINKNEVTYISRESAMRSQHYLCFLNHFVLKTMEYDFRDIRTDPDFKVYKHSLSSQVLWEEEVKASKCSQDQYFNFIDRSWTSTNTKTLYVKMNRSRKIDSLQESTVLFNIKTALDR